MTTRLGDDGREASPVTVSAVESRRAVLPVLQGTMDYGARGFVHVEIMPDGVLSFRLQFEIRVRDGRWRERGDEAMPSRRRRQLAAEPWLSLREWADDPLARSLERLWATWGGMVAPDAILAQARSLSEIWHCPPPRPLRVLVLACSATKDAAPYPLCARHRYRGPLWLTLNRLDTEQALARQFVLSAKHGLLVAEAPIGHYDLKLTPALAEQLVNDPARLATSMGSLRCNATDAVEVCLVGSKLYVATGQRLIETAQTFGILKPGLIVTPINDQIGMMRRRMAEWLNN